MPPSKPRPTTSIYPMVLATESCMRAPYPTRFTNIEAVKSHIASECNFNLRDPTKNKVCYTVALRAYQNGEFYLDVEPSYNKSKRGTGPLRDAIKSALPQILGEIGAWPTNFTHVGQVKTFIAIAHPDVQHMTFPNLDAAKFQAYMLFHAARRAWEEGVYEMRCVPCSWHRRSLSDAVERDISRLLPYLASLWPSYFSDLNAARNYVQRRCGESGFEYTYHSDVEAGRFRCFVSFNVARHAYREGRFVLDEGTEKRRIEWRDYEAALRPMESVRKAFDDSLGGRDGDIFGVSAMAYGPAAAGKETTMPSVCKSLEHGEAGVAVMSGAKAAVEVETETEVATSSTSIATDDTFTDAPEMDEPDEGQGAKDDYAEGEAKKLEEDKVDPFKALLADLRREFILKIAFE